MCILYEKWKIHIYEVSILGFWMENHGKEYLTSVFHTQN